MSVEDNLKDILNFINTSTPNLKPRVIPRGYNDKDLLGFCTSDSDKKCLQEHTKQHMPNACSIVGCGKKTKELLLTTNWGLNMNKKTYTLTGAEFLCHDCHTCTSVEDVLSLLTMPSKQSEKLVEHFLTVNNIPTTKAYVAQQVYNNAYAVQILSSNVPQYTLGVKNGKKVEPIIDQSHTIKDLLDILFSKKKKEESDSDDE
jgi:hypothetical protein